MVALTVKNQTYQYINKIPLIGMVFAESSIEPRRVLFLVFTRGLTVSLTSFTLIVTATVAQNKSRTVLISKSIVFQFLKKV